MKSIVLYYETLFLLIKDKAAPFMDNKTSFNRILIANRGEIALRAIRVCQRLGFETVAVYSTADAASPHVWAATHAVCIGPPPAQESYLSIPTLLHIAIEMNCDAVYPGYGFLAENAAFAEQCEENGIKFIGPSAETISTMGDKSKARETAVKYGVPVVPGSQGAYVDVKLAEKAAADIGYPMLIKARSGGGGRGMRIVEDEAGFASAFAQATREAEAAFNDGAVYMERFFAAVRHIEVQVFGDGKGGSLEFDERDCSVQRRHQKLVEESPSPVVSKEVRGRLLEAAGKLARGICYEGAGTVEFIFDTETDEFFFIEMNTRIQVEHTVTEVRIGLDLVEAQFDIAQGKPLPEFDKNSVPGGHAIEFRINAEDWLRDFQPSPGLLSTWKVPQADGVRLDTATYQGQRISPFYDSMIAKLIVHGRDRDDALQKSRSALAGFGCDGIATTIDFHRMLIDHEAFLANRVHTRWIETELFADDQGKTPS
jgi:acetyl-CoA carboxylase biotin carboxylase subunit